jgi:hypothetical protein
MYILSQLKINLKLNNARTINKKKRTGGMAQVVEYLPHEHNHKSLNSNCQKKKEKTLILSHI